MVFLTIFNLSLNLIINKNVSNIRKLLKCSTIHFNATDFLKIGLQATMVGQSVCVCGASEKRETAGKSFGASLIIRIEKS